MADARRATQQSTAECVGGYANEYEDHEEGEIEPPDGWDETTKEAHHGLGDVVDDPDYRTQ